MSRKLTGKLPSGWCMTDYHSGCPVTFEHGNCVCSCHKGVTPRAEKFDNSFTPFDKSKLPDYTEVVKPSKTTVKDSTPKRRGRPPGSKNKPKESKKVSFDIRPIQKVSFDIHNVSQDIRTNSLSAMIRGV